MTHGRPARHGVVTGPSGAVGLKAADGRFDTHGMSSDAVAPRLRTGGDRPPAGEGVPRSPVPATGPRIRAVLRHRAVAALVALAVVVTGALFVFFWDPVFGHSATWVNQDDLWGIFRGAQYVSWGDLGGVYNAETGIVSLPGLEVLLAPVAWLCDTLHLTASIAGSTVPRPTVDLVLVPVELVLATTLLFPVDALAEELGSTRRIRGVLSVVVGILLWPTVALWGHAEDALAMTSACSAMLAVLRGRWTRAGWLLGAGIVLQPLVALVVPLYLAASPRGGRLLFAVRCSAVSVVLAVVAFLGNPSGAYRALVEQPGQPGMNHPTPWLALAPRVTVPGLLPSRWVSMHRDPATGRFHAVVHEGGRALLVSGGPGRTIYVVLAVLLGLVVWRRPQESVRLLWLAGAVLAGRAFFEAVMAPYYLLPPLAVLLVVASRSGARRFAVSCGAALLVSWLAYRHVGPWAWWLPVVVVLSAILVVTYPRAGRDPGAGGPVGDDVALAGDPPSVPAPTPVLEPA